MVKGVKKKKNRKLMRQIRKTVGALLMVSAIAVAAIPVQDVSAYPFSPGSTDPKPEKIKVAVTSNYGEIQTKEQQNASGLSAITPQYGYKSTIPYTRDKRVGDQVVYTSGDGMFQFAFDYIDTTRRGAVILNFNNVRNESAITIPHSTLAYRKYAPNNSNDGYCLVSLNDELLGYSKYEQDRDEVTKELLYKTINRVPDMTSTATTNVVNIELTQSEVLWIDGKGYHDYNQKYEERDSNDVLHELTRTVRCQVEPVMKEKKYPCYYTTIEEWKDIPNEQLYYTEKKLDVNNKVIGDDYGNWQLAGSESKHWKVNAEIAYIGAEYIEENNTGWKVSDKDDPAQGIVKGLRRGPNDGVFAGHREITNIVFEGGMRGVSDYAFYGCTTLSSVDFTQSIETIGNGAFAECIQLQSVTIPRNASLQAIGKDAFYNCRALKDFVAPDTLEAFGDCAFEGCTALQSVNLLGSERPVSLKRLGNHLFRGCTALASLEFPDGYSEDNLDIDIFKGCTSLQFVKLPNTPSGEVVNFVDSHFGNKTDYPNCSDNEGDAWEEFRETVPESFYFEGPEKSEIHDTSHDNSITYKYPGKELYEKVVYEHSDGDGAGQKSAKVIYQVNNTGDLVKFDVLSNARPDVITIPEKIGAFGITKIAQGSFNDNPKLCNDLKRVTIPASVTQIGDNAFKGCHKLETIIFTDATTIQSIGTDAFRTQEVTCDIGDGSNFDHKGDIWSGPGDIVNSKPKLRFVGRMLNDEGKDTETFKYAMNGTSKINNNSTENIWISCHSGDPTNLEVEYNYDPKTQTGEAQLVSYPRLSELKNTSAWVSKLPYVTTPEEEAKYTAIVQDALTAAPVTPDGQAFKNAALNIAIPASVVSIKPGLFSGVYYEKDSDGNFVLDSNGNKVVHGVDTTTGKATHADEDIKSVLFNGVKQIDAFAFKDCVALEAIDVIGSEFIDDYAFEDCIKLRKVTLGTNLEDTGKRPFKGCTDLNDIECLEGSKFSCDDDGGILYRSTDSGKEIVECLENRGKTNGVGSYNVGPDELSGVSSIKPEAFANCEDVAQIDLSKTTISIIPEGAFKEMELNSIILPSTLKRIEAEAFVDNDVKRFVVYYKGDPMAIVEDAFEPKDPATQEVIFQCQKGSNADYYAMDKKYPYITSSDKEVFQEFTVIFYNQPEYPNTDPNTWVMLDKQTVRAGEAAVPPAENPKCNNPDLSFIRWTEYKNIQKDTDVVPIYDSPEYEVRFVDGFDGETLKTETVKHGRSATPPAEEDLPKHEGYVFSGWNKEYYNITEDTIITAIYRDGTGDLNRVKVTFYDDDRTTVLYVQYCEKGGSVIEPKAPTKAGYVFAGWMPSDLTNIEQDMAVVATYLPEGWGGTGTPGPSGGNGNNGGNNGGNGNNGNNGSNPSTSPDPSATPTATPDPNGNVVKYTVSVSGGSGSGSYAAGEIVAVNAYFMGEGQVFDRWTSSTAGVGFANPEASSTTFTMPAANVSITATYKTGNGSSTVNTGTGGGGGGGSTGTASNNGTTVEVTKPGISNTNVAGATVSGATDNFVVKVTEDQAATDAVVAALQARYGDISRIRYLPMDISLYDSTGRTKIADTSGISVSITLPLPDDLVQYAGNNKAAAVSNGALEDLNVRFTTVGGVPCINFTATHFSPYVIYVDTANLTEGTIDVTPKTGDPIHPKWFLALGMACLSLVLFFKRDKVVVKSKAA